MKRMEYTFEEMLELAHMAEETAMSELEAFGYIEEQFFYGEHEDRIRLASVCHDESDWLAVEAFDEDYELWEMEVSDGWWTPEFAYES